MAAHLILAAELGTLAPANLACRLFSPVAVKMESSNSAYLDQEVHSECTNKMVPFPIFSYLQGGLPRSMATKDNSIPSRAANGPKDLARCTSGAII